MPKVLRIINRFNLGGPTFNVAYLTKYMQPEYETLLIGGMKDESEESSEFILKDLGIEPMIIPEMRRSINPLMDQIAYQKIRNIIREFKPDIVHTHAAKAGSLGRLAALNCNVPVILHTFHGHVFHSYFNHFSTNVFKKIERKLARKTTSIIAISDKQKDELGNIHRICPPEKIKVIPLGFDLNRFNTDMPEKRIRFRKKWNVQEDEIAIGIIGRLVPIKNHELLFHALASIKSMLTTKVRVFIVGDGSEKIRLTELVNRLNLNQNENRSDNDLLTITFTSWIKEIDEVNAGMDIVCLTSLNEGTPVSLIEAQAAGNPVVSTNVGGIENAVLPEISALLADNDPDNYGRQLLKLISDQNLRKAMGKCGREYAIKKYSYNILVENMKLHYNELLEH